MMIAWSLDNDRLEYQLMKGAGGMSVGEILRKHVQINVVCKEEMNRLKV